jgi:type I restriction enzyme M protein
MAIKKSDLYSSIWASCDELRGGMIAAAVQGELDRVSQTLTGRIRQLAERYATPLAELIEEVLTLEAKVSGHLEKDGL